MEFGREMRMAAAALQEIFVIAAISNIISLYLGAVSEQDYIYVRLLCRIEIRKGK